MLFQSVEVHYVCRHRRCVTIKAAPCPDEGSSGRCEQVGGPRSCAGGWRRQAGGGEEGGRRIGGRLGWEVTRPMQVGRVPR